jgi:hypothetical protein
MMNGAATFLNPIFDRHHWKSVSNFHQQVDYL